MNILCVDNDEYVALLDAELQRSGGGVIRADAFNILQTVKAMKVDAAIIDVSACGCDRPDHSEPLWTSSSKGNRGRIADIYSAIRQMSLSRWGRQHDLVIFSHISRSDFDKHASRGNINWSRVQFYSKGNLEIPPILDCIRPRILERPHYISFFYTAHVPKEIRAEWIRTQASVYGFLTQYMVNRLRCVRELGVSNQQALRTMPSGYRLLYLLWVFYNEISNGGFLQYFGNVRSLERSGDICNESLLALRRLGLHAFARLLNRAIEIDASFKRLRAKSARPQTGRGRSSNANCGLGEGETIRGDRLAALDAEFNVLESAGSSWVTVVDHYIKSHPEEFVYLTIMECREK